MSTHTEKTRNQFIGVLASLAAAISLLERSSIAKKAAPSDKMFDQMIDDYKAALEAGRAALSASPVAQEPVVVNKLVNAILNELFRASDNAVIAHNTVYELKPYIERAILSTLPRASLTK